LEQSPVLAFDWGTTIMGVLDVNSNTYKAYRYKEQMIEASKMLINCDGTIISFSQNDRDLKEIAKLLGINNIDLLQINSTHNNMAPIVTNIRWPPRDGESGIIGTNLEANYEHYFQGIVPTTPDGLTDSYEISNWYDCYIVAELWKKWKQGQLKA